MHVAINKNGLFCENTFDLTTIVTGTPATAYSWSNGETTPNIIAAPTGGFYSVTVTNALGCDTSATANVSIDYTNHIQPYALYGSDKVQLKNSTIQYGSLGLKKSNGWIEVMEGSPLINYSGNFAKGQQIYVDASSSVPTQIIDPADVILPVFVENTETSTVDISVPNSGTMQLTGALYNNITVGTNATLEFTQQDISLNKLIISQGGTVKFSQPCGKVCIKSELTGDKSINLNTDMKSYIFYVEGNVTFGEGVHGNGIFYLGRPGAVDYSFTIQDYTNTRYSVMEGMVIAKTITSGKKTTWTVNNLCAGCSEIRHMQNTTDPAGNMYNETKEIQLHNYPNPFKNSTSIYFTLPEDSHVTIDVYDLAGKHISTLFDANATKNEEYKVDFNGSGLPSGVYVYKMSTDNDIRMEKMTILN